MIVKAYKYKSGLSDARRLNEHLWKRESQRPELSETRHLYAADTLAGMRVMQSLQRGSRAKIAFWHISVSPTTTLNQSDRTRVVNLIITELKAEAHPLIVVSHNDKLRARRGGGATHFHCVLGHVSPITGLALDMRNHVQRLQKVAAIAAFDIEGQTSVSSYHRSIVTHLSREGRPDVAAWLTELATKTPRLPPPRMTDAMRRSAAAVGFELAPFHARLERAWNSGASEEAFDELLADAGITIRRGDRSPDSILLYRDDLFVGAIHRILRQPRSLVSEEATSRFSNLLGKPRITGVTPEGRQIDSSSEALRQETVDELEEILTPIKTEILRLIYNSPHAKDESEGEANLAAERLKKLEEGAAIIDTAIGLLWADDEWLSVPIQKLLTHSKRILMPDKASVGPANCDRKTPAKQPAEDSVVLDEDEVSTSLGLRF
jgi:hypothetical protein